MRSGTRALRMVLITLTAGAAASAALAQKKWAVHDESRPHPKVVTPGTESTPEQPGRPPSDAIVLFDGKDLSQVAKRQGRRAGWKVENGELVVVAKSGDMVTKEPFGDCQLHVEWAAPTPPQGDEPGPRQQRRRSWAATRSRCSTATRTDTYADGQAGAIYGQYPPLVNAARPPGEWQTYDIVFHAPALRRDGKVETPAHGHRAAQRRARPEPRGAARADRATTRPASTSSTPRRSRCSSRTTATRCASATSGSGR